MQRGEIRYRLTADTKDFEAGFHRAGQVMDKTSSKAEQFAGRYGKMAGAVETTTQALSRSAGVFGVNEKGLRMMNDAAEVAVLGLNNLKTATIGFNAATLGAVGAVATLAYGLGGLLRQYKPLADAVDHYAAALRRLFTSQANLDRQALGNMSQKDWLARTGLSGRSVALEMKEQEDAAKKALKTAADAKRALTEHLNFTERVTAGVERAIDGMFDAQGAMFGATAALADGFVDPRSVVPMKRGPNLSGLMGQVARGEITPGATPAGRGGSAFDTFKGLMGNLPQVLLGAFQGGGNIGQSLGGFFGGSAGSALSGGLGKLISGGLGKALSAALPGVGTLLGGLAGKLFGGLFGGGPSKEEREAERKKQEAERQRIQSAARTMKGEGISGLMAGGGSFAFRADAEHHGTIFAAAWSQVVKEKGIAAAVEAFGGAFDRLKADIEARGLEMPAWMQAVSGQMGLGKDAAFQAASSMGTTAASFLGSFGKSGGLTPDVFKAFEQEARATFAAGKTAAEGLGQGAEDATKAGFAAANPLLKSLLNESVASGQTLSDDIKAMVAAQGIVPDVEFQQLDELRAIRAAVQGIAPAYGGGAVPPASIGDFHEGGGSIPQAAEGGFVKAEGLVHVHRGERIVPAKHAAGGGGVNLNVTVNVNGDVAGEGTLRKIAQAVKTGSGGGADLMLALKKQGFGRT